MFRQIFLIAAPLIALLAFFLSGRDVPQRPPYIQGKNRTVLVLTNKENGLSNVHIATVSSLLEQWPDIDVHFASFHGLGTTLERVSQFARKATPAARDVVFHELQGPSYTDMMTAQGRNIDTIIHEPGAAGIATFIKDIQHYISPWTAEDHLSLYNEVCSLIDEVDPAVVVLDTLFTPALDATRDKNRLHAIVSPNTLVDNFLGHQPYAGMFWKYPAMISGFDFPVSLRDIPMNIYLNLRFIYAIVMAPELAAKKAALREKGLDNPIDFFYIHRPDVPWISMDTEGASIPVDYIPPNVTRAGPIFISVAPAVAQDPKLVEWLSESPTVLINLGSQFTWSENQATVMAQAIAEVLDKSDVQILWKLKKNGQFQDDFLLPLRSYMDSGRLKVEKWLTVDPAALLESGHIVASVHHGGSSCYHEAVAAGIPHVVIPLWADLYSFAALVEGLGIGVWGCRGTNPDFTVKGISNAILKAVDGNEASVSMREKAAQLGDKVRSRGKGRDIAAQVVAKLAYVSL